MVLSLVFGLSNHFHQLYCSILAIAAVTRSRWSKLTSRYNTLVLLSVFLVYAYRDVWPLATIAEHPADITDGKLLWYKLLGLFLTAVMIPLFMPRRHVPVYSKVIYVSNSLIFSRQFTILTGSRCGAKWGANMLMVFALNVHLPWSHYIQSISCSSSKIRPITTPGRLWSRHVFNKWCVQGSVALFFHYSSG